MPLTSVRLPADDFVVIAAERAGEGVLRAGRLRDGEVARDLLALDAVDRLGGVRVRHHREGDGARVTLQRVVAVVGERAAGEVPTMVPTQNQAAANADLPADLAEIIAAWNTLPDAVRAGVLALVRATRATR